jgi:TolB-like protein/Flp pilus assembly protein TadD
VAVTRASRADDAAVTGRHGGDAVPSGPLATDARFQFGEFELDGESGELRRAGARVALQEQPLRLLQALLDAADQVVTRDQLRDVLWPPGVHVDFEHGLNAAVRRLREALGDAAGTPHFIETLPRHGYRFIAPVRRVARPAAASRSVAVLPFLDLSGDGDTSHFCDGITEDVITALSSVRALRVISRTSVMHFRQAPRTIRDVARALRVDMIVEGSVRRAGDRVRIAARLIDARSDAQVWADTYDRELSDIFRIQADVALQVAHALSPDLPDPERARLGQPATTELEAYRLYLQGRHCLFQFTEQGIRQAIRHFERAAARDPRYALPHAGIAFAYMVLGGGHGEGSLPNAEAHVRSRQAVDRALAIDGALGAAHGVDACLKFMFEFDWVGAERAFQKAMALGPASAETFDTYGLLLSALERFDEALEAQRHAHELDPLAPVVMSDIASTLLRAGRIDEALRQAEALIELEPAFPMAHSTRGWACLGQGQPGPGLMALEEAVRLSPGNTLFLAQLGQACAMTGARPEALTILARLDALAQERYVSSYHYAYVYTGLGDAARAIDCLERAVEERAGGVYGVRGSFLFRPLRDHPRFVALLRRMGLA